MAPCVCHTVQWCRRHDAPMAGSDVAWTPRGDVFRVGPFAGQPAVPYRDSNQRAVIDERHHVIYSNGVQELPPNLDFDTRDLLLRVCHTARPDIAGCLPVLHETMVKLAQLYLEHHVTE